MRQYDDAVEVRWSGPEEDSRSAGPEPAQFLWRGRLWKVRAVLARWVETPPWWPTDSDATTGRSAGESTQTPAQHSPPTSADGLLNDREYWRVEAGTRAGSGVFDLTLDRRDGRWQLVGCSD